MKKYFLIPLVLFYNILITIILFITINNIFLDNTRFLIIVLRILLILMGISGLITILLFLNWLKYKNPEIKISDNLNLIWPVLINKGTVFSVSIFIMWLSFLFYTDKFSETMPLTIIITIGISLIFLVTLISIYIRIIKNIANLEVNNIEDNTK